MNKIRLLILVFCISFFIISITHFVRYLDYSDNLKTRKEAIEYFVIDKKINTGARGESYVMRIKFKEKVYEVNLTSNTYFKIDNGVLPTLYYSNNSKSVFSVWEIKRSLRVFIVFSILSFVAMVMLFFSYFNKGKGSVLK